MPFAHALAVLMDFGSCSMVLENFVDIFLITFDRVISLRVVMLSFSFHVFE
jgi:hypothetical protein